MDFEQYLVIMIYIILIIIPIVSFLMLILYIFYTIIRRACRREESDQQLSEMIENELDNQDRTIYALRDSSIQDWNGRLTNMNDEQLSSPIFVHTYTYIDYNKNDKEYTCSICIHETNKNAVRTNCGHIFCDRCINMWLLNNTTCPYCRYKII